jgi:lipopolysaccharide/colanic/teichoic acid biosynthesis glycosyltransferase
MHNGVEAKVQNGEIQTTTKYNSIPHDSPAYTRLGRILDYIHINESPQLWNVLRGEMSMVGNRPIQRHTAAKLMDEPGFIERFDSKPGLVGYVQLVGKGSTTEEYVRLEKEYSNLWAAIVHKPIKNLSSIAVSKKLGFSLEKEFELPGSCTFGLYKLRR